MNLMAMQYLEFHNSNRCLSPYLLLLPGPRYALHPSLPIHPCIQDGQQNRQDLALQLTATSPLLTLSLLSLLLIQLHPRLILIALIIPGEMTTTPLARRLHDPLGGSGRRPGSCCRRVGDCRCAAAACGPSSSSCCCCSVCGGGWCKVRGPPAAADVELIGVAAAARRGRRQQNVPARGGHGAVGRRRKDGYSSSHLRGSSSSSGGGGTANREGLRQHTLLLGVDQRGGAVLAGGGVGRAPVGCLA